MSLTTMTDAQKVSLLFKQALNAPSTSTALDFFSEPIITARPAIFQGDLLTYAIPDSAPSELQGLSDSSLDENGRPLKGSYAGKKSNDGLVTYYHKIPLEMVPGSNGAAFQAQNATTSHPGGYGDVAGTSSSDTGVAGSYGRVTRGSIAFNYASDGSYLCTVYKNTGVAIPFGAAGGSWIFAARPGVLTFYTLSNITGVGETSPPLISFYRYTGSYGASSAAQANDYTALQTFLGGADNITINTASSDLLTAVQIDDRDISTLASGSLFEALQWGGNYDGSWRTCVQSLGSGQSLFLIQCRTGGVWVTKASYSNQ